jgi:hypothetical protein
MVHWLIKSQFHRTHDLQHMQYPVPSIKQLYGDLWQLHARSWHPSPVPPVLLHAIILRKSRDFLSRQCWLIFASYLSLSFYLFIIDALHLTTVSYRIIMTFILVVCTATHWQNYLLQLLLAKRSTGKCAVYHNIMHLDDVFAVYRQGIRT